MKDINAEDYPLLAIIGPTAAGKSALALHLAKRLGGEVVNYDSVQVYRGFDIGTGKLSAEEQQGIPHHLLDCRKPTDSFTAGDFRREALKTLKRIRERGNLPILVGGTGLYLRALLMGLFEGPPRSGKLRERLRCRAEQRGRYYVHRILQRLDPSSAGRIGPQDLQKAIRAVEVCLLAHQELSRLQAQGREPLQGFCCLKIGLNPSREALYARINQRVEKMFAAGLQEEVMGLLARPEAFEMKALGALGYRQVAAAVRGHLTWEEALTATQTATRQYAKRQMTWFRREPEVAWLAGFGDEPAIQEQALRAANTLMESRTQGAFGSPQALSPA